MNKPSNLTPLLTTYAQPLKWTLALIVLDLSTSGFTAQHGRPVFNNELIETISSCLSALLYLFVIYRLFKPRSVQDIQALMLLVLLPDPPFVYVVWTKQFFLLIVVAYRWKRYQQKLGLAIIALQIVQLVIYLNTNSPCWLSDQTPDSPKTGVFYRKIDELYSLYQYRGPCLQQKRYVLFREVQLCPGVSLLKKVAWRVSFQPVSATKTRNGTYSLWDVRPDIPK
jgi:hypothetical protein